MVESVRSVINAIDLEAIGLLSEGGEQLVDKIIVGGIEYAVEFKELECDGGVQLGYCRIPIATLEINNHNISEQIQKQTIIHEMTHAIMHEAGVDLGDDEERVVNHMSLVLYQVLKDNDFSWIHT